MRRYSARSLHRSVVVSWLLSVVLLLSGHTNAQCESIVALNLTSFEALFHECGAAVLQMETIKPPLKSVAEKVLCSSSVQGPVSVESFVQNEFNFSPAIRPLFTKHSFPAGVALVALVVESVDIEICLSSVVPCNPEEYRYIEAESTDIVLLNPTIARIRICDPGHTSTGCTLPKDSAVQLYQFQSASFVLGGEEDKRKHKEVADSQMVVGKDDSQERLLSMASELVTKNRID